MSEPQSDHKPLITRRGILKVGGALAAGAALDRLAPGFINSLQPPRQDASPVPVSAATPTPDQTTKPKSSEKIGSVELGDLKTAIGFIKDGTFKGVTPNREMKKRLEKGWVTKEIYDKYVDGVKISRFTTLDEWIMDTAAITSTGFLNPYAGGDRQFIPEAQIVTPDGKSFAITDYYAYYDIEGSHRTLKDLTISGQLPGTDGTSIVSSSTEDLVAKWESYFTIPKESEWVRLPLAGSNPDKPNMDFLSTIFPVGNRVGQVSIDNYGSFSLFLHPPYPKQSQSA